MCTHTHTHTHTHTPTPRPGVSKHKLDLENIDKNLLCASLGNKTRVVAEC